MIHAFSRYLKRHRTLAPPYLFFLSVVALGVTLGVLRGTAPAPFASLAYLGQLIYLGTILVAYLFRRFLAGSMRTRAAARSLQILDVLPLGGKKKLSVIRCYDRTFVLGIGEKEVTLVAELDRVVGEAEARAASAKDPDFERLLTTAKANLEAKRSRRAGAKRLGQVIA